MLNIPGLEQQISQPAIQGQDWQYLPPTHVFDDDWMPEDLAELWELAQAMPRKREQQLYGRMKLPRWTCKDSKHPAGKNNRGFVGHEAKCPICKSTDVKPVMKLIIGLGSYCVTVTKRGLKDGVVNPNALPLDSAPPVVKKFAAKLSKMNGGKEINYLSFIAYENERDHIGWHQHNEDRCRDAKVYILSMGEERTFGVRQVCEKHGLPAKTCVKNCETTCLDGPTALCKRCSAQMQARNTCPECESVRPGFKGKRKGKPWTAFQPEHGSIIVLNDEANETVEHAILQDKGPKGLRISINTKNIRPEDVNEVEGAGVTRMLPVSSPIPSGTLRKLSPQVNKPRVYSIKRKHPKDAVYVGCAGAWPCCKCHEQDVRSGSRYGNSYTPRKWGGHMQNPIARTPDEYRTKLDALWNSPEPKAVAWKERAIKELRGKNLLCWCLQPEDVDGVKVTDPEGCHARVLFEYVNRKDQ
ncbi:MAG: alpha-ketoglutarate-dependent dioxygenase AlkB [Candidatus Acidiferrales bacterium]